MLTSSHPTKLKDEFKNVIDLVLYIFKTLDFTDYVAQVSLRDPEKPEKYIDLTKTG